MCNANAENLKMWLRLCSTSAVQGVERMAQTVAILNDVSSEILQGSFLQQLPLNDKYVCR